MSPVIVHDARGLVEGRVRDDRAIEITLCVICVADGKEKEIERPARAGRVFGHDLFNVRARNERAGRIVDGADFVDSAFLDRDREREFDGLIRDDGGIDLGDFDFDRRITLIP